MRCWKGRGGEGGKRCLLKERRGCRGLTDMPRKAWIGEVLNILVNSEELFNLGEKECAFCWATDIEVNISETPETERTEKGLGSPGSVVHSSSSCPC